MNSSGLNKNSANSFFLRIGKAFRASCEKCLHDEGINSERTYDRLYVAFYPDPFLSFLTTCDAFHTESDKK